MPRAGARLSGQTLDSHVVSYPSKDYHVTCRKTAVQAAEGARVGPAAARGLGELPRQHVGEGKVHPGDSAGVGLAGLSSIPPPLLVPSPTFRAWSWGRPGGAGPGWCRGGAGVPGLRGPRAPGGVDQGQAVSGWRGSGAQAQAGGWGLDRHCMCCQGPGRGQHGHLPPQPGVTQGRPHSHPASFLIITQLSLFFVRYNLHDLKLTTLKSTLRWHLAQASPQSSSRTFHLPKGDPIAISRHSPSPPLPWRPPTCFLSQQMHLMSQSFTQAPHGPLCLALSRSVHSGPPSGGRCQNPTSRNARGISPVLPLRPWTGTWAVCAFGQL